MKNKNKGKNKIEKYQNMIANTRPEAGVRPGALHHDLQRRHRADVPADEGIQAAGYPLVGHLRRRPEHLLHDHHEELHRVPPGIADRIRAPGRRQRMDDAFMRMREEEPDFEMPRGGLVSVYMDEQRADKYYFSPEKWVTPETPPFFLWQTTDMDDPRNMMCFAKELADVGVLFEAHIFPFGPHGMALADGTGLGRPDPHVARWSELAIEWLKLYGFQGSAGC